MQRTCARTYSLSKGLMSATKKFVPIYYRPFTRNRYSVLGRNTNHKYSLPNVPNSRCGSSHSGSNKSGGGKVVLLGGVTVFTLIGGTLGYAGVDPDFRAYVEEMLPGAKEAFETILGNSKATDG